MQSQHFHTIVSLIEQVIYGFFYSMCFNFSNKLSLCKEKEHQ